MTGRKKVPKRFEEKWATHPECEGIIHEAWNGVISTGCLMYKLFEKIKTTSMSLLGWSRQLGNSKTKLEEKKLELKHLTVMNNADNLDVIQKVKDEINALLLQEELFWGQRSRSIWLLAGDKNTKYFHQRASQRCRKNQIIGLLDDQGRWCNAEADIAREAENYFKELFTSGNLTNLNLVLNSVDRIITPNMNQTLLQPYTLDEVKRALFHMHPSKSPGLDGMSPFFSKNIGML